MSKIQDEIVRLVTEIAEDELEIKRERRKEAHYTEDVWRREHQLKAEALESSLERKLRLLEVLTRVHKD